MNRFVVTMGERDGAGNIVRGTTGYDIGYDIVDRRVQFISSHPDTNGQTADSGPSRHLIPAHAGTRFRSKPAGIPVMPAG